LFPHSKSVIPEELEEERRLCYVGITRAKNKLYLSYANRRLIFGSFIQNLRSRFIDEIPSDLKEEIIPFSENDFDFENKEENEESWIEYQ